MNKRGQMFLIAALIIVGLIIGISSINISTRSQAEDRTVFDLSKEFDFEGKKVIDYGVYSGSTGTIKDRVDSLLMSYSKAEAQTEITLVYGNKDNLCTATVQEKGCQVCLAYLDPLNTNALRTCVKGDSAVAAACSICAEEFDSWEGWPPIDQIGRSFAFNTLKTCISDNSGRSASSCLSESSGCTETPIYIVQPSTCSAVTADSVKVPTADGKEEILPIRDDAQNFYVVIVRKASTGETTVATNV